MKRLVSLATAGVLVAMIPGPAAMATASTADADNGIRPAAQCGGTAWAPPGGGWGPKSQSTVPVIGVGQNAQVIYGFRVQGNVPTIVGLELLGYDKRGNSKWVRLPPLTGSGAAGVHWGEVAGLPAIRAKSINVINGVFVTWTC
jgi:hypothetical protein